MMHLPTIISISILLNVIIGSFLLSLYFLRQQSSYLYWGSSCLIFVCAQIAASLRVFIDFPLITHYLADLFIISAPLAAILGIHAYSQSDKKCRNTCAYVLVAAAVILLLAFDSPFSQLITTAIIAACFSYAAFALRKLHVKRIMHLGAVDLCSTYINQPTLVATS